MFLIPLATSLEEVSISSFWESVLLYHNSPHLINRRLAGAINILYLKVGFKSNSIKSLSEILTRTSILYEVRKLKELSQQYITQDLIKSILEPFDKNVVLNTASIEDFISSEDDVFVTVKILLPRQNFYESCVEVAILDKKNRAATFLAVIELDKKQLAPPFPYTLEYLNPGYRICVDLENAESRASDWLVNCLFVKLENWIGNCGNAVKTTSSLSLVSLEVYTKLYNKLKEKYGKELVKAWPEKQTL